MQGSLTWLTSPGEWVLKASAQASVLIIIVLLVQIALRSRLSPRWRFALWYLVLARLMLPALPETAFSIFNFARPAVQIQRALPRAIGHAAAPTDAPVIAPLFFPESSETPAHQSSPAPLNQTRATRLTSKPLSLSQALALGWLLGIIALTSRVILGLRNMSRRLGSSQPADDPALLALLEECKARMRVKQQIRLFASDQFLSPCLIGFLKPRLQLPAALLHNFSEQELRLIFLHELAHVKRRDILINWLCTVAQILHWFNPLVWLAFSRMRAHREVACDALALTTASAQDRDAYGDTIIRLLEGFTSTSAVVGSVGILEDRHQIRERIRMIARFKIASRWSLLAAPLLLVIGLFCLTDAQVSPPANNPSPARAETKAAVANPKMIVKVLNEKEEPIANAILQANYFTEDNIEGHDVVTDADGVARIPERNHPDEPIYRMNLWVTTKDHVPKLATWNQYSIPVEYTFKLVPGRKLGGLVVNEKGQPVPDANIKIWVGEVPGEHDEMIEFHPRLNKIVTDSNGRWSCNFIPADFKELRLTLTHSNYAVTEKTVELPKAFLEETRIVLAHANTIIGRVLSDTGAPIAGAHVREVHNFGWRKADTKSDTAGNFILTGLRDGPTLIVVQAEGRAPDARTVDLAGDVNAMEFRLAKGSRFSGRVVDQAGQPVANVEVGTASDNQGIKKVEFATHTDADGRWEWASAPDEQLLFYVRGKGIRFLHGFSLGPGEHEIKVVREERDHILITGKVLDAKTGEPIPAFHITLGQDANGYLGKWTSLGADGHAGEFKLPIGKPAPWPTFNLQATAPGYFPVISRELTIEGGDQSVELRMTKGVALAGTIVFPDGTPVSGASVFLCGARTAPYMDTPGRAREMDAPSRSTGADGSFQLDPFAQQHSVVVIHSDGYLEMPVAVFEKTNRFVLQPYGRVEGTLYRDGKPAADETITVTSMRYRYGLPGTPKREFPVINLYLNSTTDQNGKFSLDKVPPGERQIYQVLSSHPGKPGPIGTHHQTYLVVKPGETSHIDLGPLGRKVIGRINLKSAPQGFDWTRDVQRLESKAPIPNRPLDKDFPDRKEWIAAMQKWGQADRAFWESDEGYAFARTHHQYCPVFNDSGRFVIHDVLPGPYTLAIRLTTEPAGGPLGPSRFPFDGSEIASTFRDIMVPSGDSDSTVDMGEIFLEARPPQLR
jgi:beta-lactamase regulating signal transducer with metallopeptidase domain/uncharacterized GH25 family protein